MYVEFLKVKMKRTTSGIYLLDVSIPILLTKCNKCLVHRQNVRGLRHPWLKFGGTGVGE